ncbi:MoaD/ThiS family protein [Microbacterium sp. LTA6]|uniref:MoaD/ThiS family protein n=1 Tax=Microbacterium sp. LTA6 TaxID=3129771 RepID=UPI00325379E8
MKLRYFAGAADAAGREEQQVHGPITLGALRVVLSTEHGPEFADVLGRCSLLVDGTRGGDDVVVPDDATVDVLPPFAGG